MKASIEARLAALESAGSCRAPDPMRQAIMQAVAVAAAKLGGWNGRGSRADAVAGLLGLSAGEQRAMLRDRPGDWLRAVLGRLGAEAERREVTLDELVMEAVER